MRKPNYSAEKRKRQLAKQAKRDAKRQRKQSQQPDQDGSTLDEVPEAPLDERDAPANVHD